MKTSFSFSSILTLSVVALVGCAPANKKLESAPETPGTYSMKADLKSEVTSEVDILFVIDNSRSMMEEQTILQNNIEDFVKALQSMNTDYHIGVVTTHDQGRIHQNSKNYWANGRLRPLKNPGSPAVSIKHEDGCVTTDALAGTGAKKSGFITPKTQNGLAILRESLKVGVLCLPDGGPEKEELFSPALAAVGARMTAKGQPNEGFYRDSAHLAVVILSDATPSERDVSVDDFLNELRGLKGNNPKLLSVHVIGVTAADVARSKAQGKNATCRVDYGLEDESNNKAMENVIAQANGQSNGTFLRLCSQSWGKELTKISSEIKRRLSGKVVAIPHAFELIEEGKLVVKVNGVVTPSGSKTWVRDTRSNSIVFSDELNLGANNDAVVEISYVTLTSQNARRARAH